MSHAAPPIRRRRITVRRTLAAAAAGALVTGAAKARSASRRAMDPVDPALRSPLLAVPVNIGGEKALRRARALMDRLPSPVVDGVKMSERLVRAEATDGARTEPVAVYVYEPPAASGGPNRTGEPRPAVLWIHGGGLVMGRAAVSHARCSTLAAELGAVVVNVEYRLAPEHPFPAGLDDCMAALRWIHQNAEDLGIDRTRVAVGGESAGGGLAAVVAQRARDEGHLPLAFQLLIYPMLDDLTVQRADPGAILWTASSNRFAWTAYLGGEPAQADDRPYISAARHADLAGLPPAWIGVGDIDLFHDEDVAYAERLRAAGVECDLYVVPGMYHAADGIAAKTAPAREFTRRAHEALRRAIT